MDQDDSLKAIDQLLALPDDELKKKFDNHIETGLGKLVTDAIYGQDDKKPREWWIHCTGNAYTRDVSSNFPVDHVIEFSAYQELARKLEVMNCEYNAAIDLRNELAKERARNAKLVSALEKSYLEIVTLLNEGDFKRLVELDLGYIVDALATGQFEDNMRRLK